VLEKSFRSLGTFSQKRSRTIILLWIAAIVLLAPFAGLLFSETSYNLASGIFPSNSMSSQAQKLLHDNFPSSVSQAGDQSLIIVTTGTDVNQRNVVDRLLTMDSLLVSYLKSRNLSGNITSIFTVENSTMQQMSHLAKGELAGTYSLLNTTASGITALNSTLNGTLRMVYGIPALFLNCLKVAGGNASLANSYVMKNISAEGYTVRLYYTTFYSYWNSSVNSNLTMRTYYAISQDILNSSSQYYQLSVANGLLHQMSVSLMQNFSLSDFSLSTNSERTHFFSYVYNFTEMQFVPSLSSSSEAMSLIVSGLNLTVQDFFNVSYSVQGQGGDIYGSTAVTLVSHGIQASLEYNPFIAANPMYLATYLSLLNATNSVSNLVSQTVSSAGFSQYPFVPTPYVYHQFVGYDNSTVIFILTTAGELTSAESVYISSLTGSEVSPVPGSHFYLAGSTEQNNQLSSETLTGMIRALIIGIVLSIIIVGVFFRSVTAAFLPLLMFGVSALSAFSVNGLVYKYILHSSISFITPTLLLILLLGLSSDYVVYMMSRFRRELRRGNKFPAIVSTQWAGHAIFTSGATVALSYIALYVSGVPLFSDSGITNAIGVLLAVLVSNTLLVAMLNIFRERIFWPSKLGSNRPDNETTMYRISSFVIDNKGKILAVFLILAIVGTYVYASTPTNFDVFDLIPASSGIRAIEVVNSGFHGDLFDLGYIILQFPSPVLINNSSYNQTEMLQITSIEDTLAGNSHIAQIQGPTYPFGSYVPFNLSNIPSAYKSAYEAQMLSFVGSNATYVRITFELSSLAWRSQSSSFVSSMPSLLYQSVGGNFKLFIGGLTEGFLNAYSFTSLSFAKLVPVLAFAILAVLAIQLTSIFTPARLIAMVLASVVIALAITYIALYYALHLPILIFLPMFTVITLLAVGLDYDIFMVTRVREEVIHGRSDRDGISTSIIENGGVIVTLGSLLFVTFASLIFSGLGIIQEIGLGLAVGVLIDTFVSWPFFVPAVMLYLRKYNWWPSRIGRPRRVVYRNLRGRNQ
jgi:RND superfamily putative drug exporter